MPSSETSTRPRIVRESDPDLIAAIIELADKNRSTLGLMPRGAFPEFAAKGGLLAAVNTDGRLAGYAMFSAALGRIRLIHLCVAEGFRGQGISGQLVRAVSDQHPDLAGILLKCRRDYAATDLWPALGFEARNEVAGRGNNAARLVIWWLSHNIPDLFNLAEDPATTTVAIDHNVFIDLAIDPSRSGAEESQALDADWIRAQITLTVTRESRNEIIRNPDPDERKRQLLAIGAFPEFSYGTAELAAAQSAWRSEVGSTPPEDRSDCNHIISAAAGSAHIMVTRDERLIDRYAGPAADVFDMLVLRPSDLIAHLDELANGIRYRPAELRGTGFTVVEYGAGAETVLDQFLDNSAGERKADYHRRLRQIVADSRVSRRWVRDPQDRVVAVWATRCESTSLEVGLFRIGRSPLAATVGRLIAFELRQQALDLSVRAIRVSDSHLPAGLRADLVADGFVPTSTGLVAAVLDVRSRAEVANQLEGHPLREMIQSALDSASTTQQALALERALWPAKFLDSDLPSYIVPIRPGWANELFDLGNTLFERPALLGVSREHVYYRTPRGNPRAPARIAWYASDTSRRGIGAIVAVSHLVEVDTGVPAKLYRRYQRLGVYRLTNVQDSARDGRASALRFIDTETLLNPVPLEDLRALSKGRQIGTLQSPTMIDSALFGAIYREGTGRGA